MEEVAITLRTHVVKFRALEQTMYLGKPATLHQPDKVKIILDLLYDVLSESIEKKLEYEISKWLIDASQNVVRVLKLQPIVKGKMCQTFREIKSKWVELLGQKVWNKNIDKHIIYICKWIDNQHWNDSQQLMKNIKRWLVETKKAVETEDKNVSEEENCYENEELPDVETKQEKAPLRQDEQSSLDLMCAPLPFQVPVELEYKPTPVEEYQKQWVAMLETFGKTLKDDILKEIRTPFTPQGNYEHSNIIHGDVVHDNTGCESGREWLNRRFGQSTDFDASSLSSNPTGASFQSSRTTVPLSSLSSIGSSSSSSSQNHPKIKRNWDGLTAHHDTIAESKESFEKALDEIKGVIHPNTYNNTRHKLESVSTKRNKAEWVEAAKWMENISKLVQQHKTEGFVSNGKVNDALFEHEVGVIIDEIKKNSKKPKPDHP